MDIRKIAVVGGFAVAAAPLTTLDYELYGPFASLLIGVDNPLSGDPYLDPAPGAQDVSNGALAEFDDAYNAVVNGLDDSALIPTTDLVSPVDIATVEAGDITTEAGLFANFWDTGLADILAGLNLPFDSL